MWGETFLSGNKMSALLAGEQVNFVNYRHCNINTPMTEISPNSQLNFNAFYMYFILLSLYCHMLKLLSKVPQKYFAWFAQNKRNIYFFGKVFFSQKEKKVSADSDTVVYIFIFFIAKKFRFFNSICFVRQDKPIYQLVIMWSVIIGITFSFIMRASEWLQPSIWLALFNL